MLFCNQIILPPYKYRQVLQSVGVIDKEILEAIYMDKSGQTNAFSILDWIGIIYVVMHIIGLFVFPKIALAFGEMYADFGGSLPNLTQIVIKPWFSISLGIICLCIFSLQWLTPVRNSLKRRRAVIVLSFLTATASSALCIIGLYQPVFRAAGAIG